MQQSTQQPTLEQLRARHGGRYKWLVLLTVLLGTMSSILSSTIVNVAIPDLSHHFQIGQGSAQWVAAGFMLSMTLSMLTTPWLLLRFGLRRTYTGAIVLLLAGGVIGGFSFDFSLLLAMRVAQGLAAGVLQPIPNIVILRAFDPDEQGRAMGLFGFGVVLAPAIGPSVGGFLVELFGWRSIFFVVVPFCIAALWLIRRFLPINSSMLGDAKSLDWKGLLLVGISTMGVLNGLAQLRAAPLQGVGLLALGAVALVAFLWLERRSEQPLIHLGLFRYRQFTMGALVAFIYGMGLFGSTYLLPVYMQMALHYSPSHAGLVLLPAGIVLAVAIPLAGRLADSIAPHLLVTFGLGLLTLSFGLMTSGSLTTTFLTLAVWAVIGRIGLGFVLPSLTLGSMRGIDSSLIAQGASTVSFVRQMGGAIGVSVAGIVLEWRLGAHHASLTEAGTDAAARIHAFDETFWLVTVICALAMVAAWRMRPAPAAAPT